MTNEMHVSSALFAYALLVMDVTRFLAVERFESTSTNRPLVR